ncbi:hypothetical protein Gpo141_00008647 [Globisporangium polare]
MCTCVAWAINFCVSRGDVFSPTPVREQSYTSVIAADVVMCHVFSSYMSVVTLAQVMRSQEVTNNPEQPSAFCSCVAKLVKATISPFLASLALVRLLGYLLSFAAPSVRPCKLEFYLSCLCSHLSLSYAELATRQMIRYNVFVRQQRLDTMSDASDHKPGPQAPPPPSASDPSSGGHRPTSRRPRSSCSRF